MTIKFKIGDRVMYRDIGEKPLIGTITSVAKYESGESIKYDVKLDSGRIISCIPDELAHLELDKL